MRPVFFLVAAALFALPLCLPAAAQSRRAPGVLTLDRILPEVRRTHPGQFYDADGPTGSPDGSQHYHLKWMTPDGRIEWLDTDARTGRVLSASPGRDNFDGPGPERYYAPAPSYPLPQNYGPQNYGGGFRGWPGGYGGQRGRDYGGGGRSFGGGGGQRRERGR
jgi:uncharacterized membrane protein YgcG